MGRKSSAHKKKRFLTKLCQLSSFVHVCYQIVAHLPQSATELVRFLEMFKFGVFFEKMDECFSKKNLIFLKIAIGAKFAVE